MPTTYASPADLALAIPPETVLALFDDNRDGTADTATVEFFINMAESYVNHVLEQLYPVPFAGTIPAIVRYATVFLAVSFAYDRSPEYVRATGEKLFERAKMLLDDIRAGRTGLDAELGIPRNERSIARSGNPLDPDAVPLVFNGPGMMGDF